MVNQTTTIPNGWKMTTLEKVADFCYGKMPDKSKVKVRGEYPVYSGYQVSGYYDEFNSDEDLIVVARGVGGTGDVKISPKKSYVTNLSIIIKLDQGAAYKKYFYYKFLLNNLRYLDSGSAQSQIVISDLKGIQLLLPPVPEQRAIAAVLSSLDDKIELLREQNKTLEATAQAIFKEWFANFNFPGATGKMIDSELGEIPEGWRAGKLGDEFDITIGRTPPRLETEWFSGKPTGKKWISIKDIGNSEIYISNTSEYLTDEAIEKFNIPVIPENTTILSFKMTVGKLAITTEEMLSNEAIAHLKIKSNTNLSTEYIYLFLKGLDFNSLGSTSSIVTAINSTMIKMLDVLVPDDRIMKNFNALIQPIFAKLKNNNFQIQVLSKLRDALLLKLMKGDVRVKGFEN